MLVQVTQFESQHINGCINGYSYSLVQSLENNLFAYRITNPEGFSRIVILDSDGVRKLCSDPSIFWNNFIN